MLEFRMSRDELYDVDGQADFERKNESVQSWIMNTLYIYKGLEQTKTLDRWP